MEGLPEWGCGRVVVEGGGQTGAQQAIVEADKEQGGSEPGIGDAVAVAARERIKFISAMMSTLASYVNYDWRAR